MVTLSDYLGFLMKEISHARLSSDLASIELAKMYAENELLRNLSVPRVRLSRIDVSVPLVVESLKMDQASDFRNLNSPQNQDALNRILSSLFTKHFDVKFSREEQKNISARIRLGTEPIARKSAYQEGRNDFERFTEDTFIYAVNLKDIRKLQDFDKRFDQSLHELRSQFMALFDAQVQPGPTKLEAMVVNPVTAAIRAAQPPQSIFVLNLSLTEEGIELVTVQDSEGNTKKVLVIE